MKVERKLPRQECMVIAMSAGLPSSALLVIAAYFAGSVSGSSPRSRECSRSFGSHIIDQAVSSICR